MCLIRSTLANLCSVMNHFNALDFSECRSEEVISFFWHSVYNGVPTGCHDGGQTIATEINIHLCKHLFASLGLFTKERIMFRKPFRHVIRTLSWFESQILPFVNTKLFQIRLLKREKRAFWIGIRVESLILRTCKRKALSKRGSCVCILEMCTEAAMHGSISADCAVGTQYYLAVRRSSSWLGRHLQCMWTHIVQITNPIRKLLSERDSFLCEQAHCVLKVSSWTFSFMVQACGDCLCARCVWLPWISRSVCAIKWQTCGL